MPIVTPLEKLLNTIQYNELSSTVQIRVGIRTNAIPHIGTWLTIAFCFAIARYLPGKHKPRVHVQLLDNSTISNADSPYCHGQWQMKSDEMTRRSSMKLAEKLSRMTGVPLETSVYSMDQQKGRFRQTFLESVQHLNALKKLSPLEGFIPGKTVIGIRLECPQCGLFHKDGHNTRVADYRNDYAVFACTCPDHGRFDISITQTNRTFLNLTTIYRNIIKEAVACQENATTVVVKASDWLLAALLIDEGLSIMNRTSARPLRFFTPQTTTKSGIKLSKSWISEGRAMYRGIDRTLLDMNIFRERYPDYAERILKMAGKMLQRTDHTFRAYTCSEISEALL